MTQKLDSLALARALVNRVLDEFIENFNGELEATKERIADGCDLFVARNIEEFVNELGRVRT